MRHCGGVVHREPGRASVIHRDRDGPSFRAGVAWTLVSWLLNWRVRSGGCWNARMASSRLARRRPPVCPPRRFTARCAPGAGRLCVAVSTRRSPDRRPAGPSCGERCCGPDRVPSLAIRVPPKYGASSTAWGRLSTSRCRTRATRNGAGGFPGSSSTGRGHWTVPGIRALAPPRTRVEETVLDLIDVRAELRRGVRLDLPGHRAQADHGGASARGVAARSRVRWRREVELALGYAEGGALSVLEYRYVRGVERAHGLPMASRQARVRQATGNRYLDNLYVAYRACVEIDGTAAHPADEQWRDKGRDRWNAVHEGIETIRVGVLDLISKERQCRTAADVARWLSGRGPAVGRPCGPGCPVSLVGVVRTTYGQQCTPNVFGRVAWRGAGGLRGADWGCGSGDR